MFLLRASRERSVLVLSPWFVDGSLLISLQVAFDL